MGRVVMQSIHFTNTLLLLGALALTAWFLQRRSESTKDAGGAKGLAWLAVAAQFWWVRRDRWLRWRIRCFHR